MPTSSFDLPPRPSRIGAHLRLSLSFVSLSCSLDVYPSLSFRDILPVLVKRLASLPRKASKVDLPPAIKRRNGVVPNAEDKADEAKFGKGVITQRYLWPRMQKFFEEGDVILAESGTAGSFYSSPFMASLRLSPLSFSEASPLILLFICSFFLIRAVFGVFDIPYPRAATSVTQVLWGSIGWSVGATLGAAVAVRESKQPDRRTVLLCGDGALQLSVQEIGSMIRR